MNERQITWNELLTTLPTPIQDDVIDGPWQAAVKKITGKVIVLDDDPTGTQTVHSIPVYTSWDADALRKICHDDADTVYILTNSRALPARDTEVLHRQLAQDLVAVFGDAKQDFLLISRSDSTLRGHYPLETTTLCEELSHVHKINGEILIPFFLEGGRITVRDIHYVKEGEVLTPAGQTEFARDAVFGYRSSNLKEWIEEKTDGTYRASDVASISLDMLRARDIEGIVSVLVAARNFAKIIVNSADYADLRVFVTALAESLARGKRFIFRTAASFVQVVGGIRPIPLLTPPALYPNGKSPAPGLVIAGSYVQKTTRQIEALRNLAGMTMIEWDVTQANTRTRLEAESQKVGARIEAEFARGNDVCVYTTREYIGGKGRAPGNEQDLLFSQKISDGLVRVIRTLAVQPGYLVAKGGITSSDIGVKGLGIKRAMIMGQIQPGVPVWRLGSESRFPGLPYVVFPGNVGADDGLKAVVEILRT